MVIEIDAIAIGMTAFLLAKEEVEGVAFIFIKNIMALLNIVFLLSNLERSASLMIAKFRRLTSGRTN